MNAFMSDSSVTKENKAFDDFLKNNHGFYKNDSLYTVFKSFYKRYLNRRMLYLKKYPDDYFSFWYFIQQVAQPYSTLESDKGFLKEQLAYLKAVFPPRFTQSTEGKELIKTFETAINPANLNNQLPQFSITTISGKKVNIKELRGKYVLLDFWATWCPPCMAELPFIKEIRKTYPPEKLVIIGISQDVDLKKLNAVITKEDMNWLHFYDRSNENPYAGFNK